MRLTLAAALTIFVANLLIASSAAAATFTIFDAPNGTNTFPTAINNAGAIIGHYLPDSGGEAAFVRSADGAFALFQVKNSTQTVPFGIRAI